MASQRRHSDTANFRESSPLIRKQRSANVPAVRAPEPAEYGSLPNPSDFLNSTKEVDKYSMPTNNSSIDDFGDELGLQQHKNIKSGRQRKKIASRTKGGEFQARRRKRRLYFCCLSSEIDVEGLEDKFQSTLKGLKGSMYDEVLHLYTEKTADLAFGHGDESSSGRARRSSSQDFGAYLDGGGADGTDTERRTAVLDPYYAHMEQYTHDNHAERLNRMDNVDVSAGGREAFVFAFGAVVFWGCSREEANDLLAVCREHIVKGRLSQTEFEAGEDDMAFVTAYEADGITIANDVILLPEHTSVQSRLAVSFAIAQSAVLSIFEDRIEQKIGEYKFIPEELASTGRVQLTPKQLGLMIGEVFVIRHDVNLHSEILDIPDYFWKANEVEPLYRMAAMYLEMEPRTEVLNKRLDLLQELLRLVQHQHENAHNIKLEWIIIWLIVVSVILEMYTSVGEYLRWPYA